MNDLDEIGIYLEREAPFYAKSVIAQIMRVAEALDEMPYRGRTVPEFGLSELRELFCYNYRIIYRVGDGEIEVVTVFHGSRLLRPTDVSP